MFINTNSRKRKERTDQKESREDLDNFRSEIMMFLKEFAKTQNENLSIIRDDITVIKDEIKDIKSATENFTLQLKLINDDIENIKSDNTKTQQQIQNIIKDISDLKTTETSSDRLISKSPARNHENLILELKERSEREKNIVIVGIPEINDKNYKARQIHDADEFMKLAFTANENCPKPVRSMRLGKYIPGRDRPLKICFNNIDTPKQLLRNKDKFPEHTKIYSDRTPAQKEYMATVKMDLAKRLENGEKDLIIKYIRGIPQITESKVDQKN